jgi:hypothetical protein
MTGAGASIADDHPFTPGSAPPDPTAWRTYDGLHAAGLIDHLRLMSECLQLRFQPYDRRVLFEFGRAVTASEIRQRGGRLRIEFRSMIASSVLTT